jgi:hypothetical protein
LSSAASKMLRKYYYFALLGISILSCGLGQSLPTRVPSAPTLIPPNTPLPESEKEETSPTSTPTRVEPTITPSPIELWAGDGVPAELRDAARALAERNPGQLRWLADPEGDLEGIALIQVEAQAQIEWIYAVVAPFATVADSTTLDEVIGAWQGNPARLGKMIVDQETAAVFTEAWGPPGGQLQEVSSNELVDQLWADRPAWSLIPFHRIEPALKVIIMDGMSPISNGFDPAVYPLRVGFSWQGEPAATSFALDQWQGPFSNRDVDRLTTVAMTGVTALGRATAYQMEIQGITTPADVVGPILAGADVTHISHEVPFAPDCPFPNPVGDPVFCARDGYMALLEAVGTDVIELTGNHVNDWGTDNLLHTIDLYQAAGMQIFGGGRELAEAREPALFEHNGNKIAFVGCNPVGPPNAWAGDDRPGALPCDYPAMKNEIARLRDEGYLVIATLQYAEHYQYRPTVEQQSDFRALIDAGATAVSGSQGHHAQAFDLYQGGFIHFGLGNLFFDQMDMLGTRQSFADFYVFYEGRLLAVDLVTTLIESYCCPRAMTEAERADLLTTVFEASGW